MSEEMIDIQALIEEFSYELVKYLSKHALTDFVITRHHTSLSRGITSHYGCSLIKMNFEEKCIEVKRGPGPNTGTGQLIGASGHIASIEYANPDCSPETMSRIIKEHGESEGLIRVSEDTHIYLEFGDENHTDFFVDKFIGDRIWVKKIFRGNDGKTVFEIPYKEDDNTGTFELSNDEFEIIKGKYEDQEFQSKSD